MNEPLSKEEIKRIQNTLATVFGELLANTGNSPEVRLAIVKYTFGYMGASYGLHIEVD
jgi:hypothetical protein